MRAGKFNKKQQLYQKTGRTMIKPSNLSMIHTLILAMFFSTASTLTLAASTLISRPVTTEMTTTFHGQLFKNFNHFLQTVHNEKHFNEFATTINAYISGTELSQKQQRSIYRLLGIYTRIQYGDAAIDSLRHLVSFPTVESDTIPTHENPHFINIGKAIEQLAADFNLDFINVDNRVFAVSLNGHSKKTIALHAHADVVPANKNAWRLDDGTQLDPFSLTRVGNRLYGRGTEDDKNGIVVALYAMKVIREEGIELFNNFRLLVDTTEENDGNAIPYYLQRYPVPDYNIALDGAYPVVIAEKGYGTVTARFPVRRAEGNGIEFIGLSGASASNQIPTNATATLLTEHAVQTKKQIDKLAAAFVTKHGNNFSITSQLRNDTMLLTVTGVSAHSSTPATGINPVSRLLVFIDLIRQKLAVKDNHITDAARYASDNWGIDYTGKKLAIDYSDEFMGPLTAALTYIALDDRQLQLDTNLRMPKGKTPDQLKADIASALAAWQNKNGVNIAITHTQDAPMYHNPKGRWINALLDIASENLGIARQFRSDSGATSIHDLPNGVQFGLAVPGQKYTGHNANEFKTVDQFLLDLQIVTEMVVTLGSIKKLDSPSTAD